MTMAKYISAEIAKKALAESDLIPRYAESCKPITDRIIDSLTAADVAPVVRCRDCLNSYEGIDGRICAYGPCVDCVVPDDFFCSFGERRAENASKEM